MYSAILRPGFDHRNARIGESSHPPGSMQSHGTAPFRRNIPEAVSGILPFEVRLAANGLNRALCDLLLRDPCRPVSRRRHTADQDAGRPVPQCAAHRAKVLEAKPCGFDAFLRRQMLPDVFGQYCVYRIRCEEAPPISIHENIQLIDVGENPPRRRISPAPMTILMGRELLACNFSWRVLLKRLRPDSRRIDLRRRLNPSQSQ